MSEFENWFEDWSDLVEVRLDSIESQLQDQDWKEFDRFERDMENQLENINDEYDELFNQINELIEDGQSDEIIFTVLIQGMNSIDSNYPIIFPSFEQQDPFLMFPQPLDPFGGQFLPEFDRMPPPPPPMRPGRLPFDP